MHVTRPPAFHQDLRRFSIMLHDTTSILCVKDAGEIHLPPVIFGAKSMDGDGRI